MTKVIDNMTFEEFMQYVEDLDLEPILDYDDWFVYKIGRKYYFSSIDDKSFEEIKLMGCISLSDKRIRDIDDDIELSEYYPNAFVTGDDGDVENGKYYWFRDIVSNDKGDNNA